MTREEAVVNAILAVTSGAAVGATLGAMLGKIVASAIALSLMPIVCSTAGAILGMIAYGKIKTMSIETQSNSSPTEGIKKETRG